MITARRAARAVRAALPASARRALADRRRVRKATTPRGGQ